MRPIPPHEPADIGITPVKTPSRLSWYGVLVMAAVVAGLTFASSGNTGTDLPYRLGWASGSALLGYGVYRAIRWAWQKGNPETPGVEPTHWYRKAWVKALAVVAIIVAGAVLAGLREPRLELGDSPGAASDAEDSFFVGMRRSADLPDESWDCIEERLRASGVVTDILPVFEGMTPTEVEEAFTAALAGLIADSPPEFAALAEEVMEALAGPDACITQDELIALAGTTDPLPGTPMTYGSDPDRDDLYDRCEAGSMLDCDMLWLVAEVGSEYDEYAATCGGNEPIDMWLTSCSLIYAGTDGVEEATGLCDAGYLPACTIPAWYSQPGSPEEILSQTCGGRREASVVPCWIDLGFGSR